MKRFLSLVLTFFISVICIALPTKAKASHSQSCQPENRIIERIDKVRSAYANSTIELVEDDVQSGDSDHLAQWYNWPNWGNWGNWPNWPNY